jgi:hypothetical protein
VCVSLSLCLSRSLALSRAHTHQTLTPNLEYLTCKRSTRCGQEAREERKKALADPAAQMHKYLHKTREHKEEKKKKSKRDGQGRRHREREGREGSAGQLSEAEKRAKLEKLRSERLAREVGRFGGGGCPWPLFPVSNTIPWFLTFCECAPHPKP